MLEKIDLDVKGMHCASCAAVLQRALTKTPGVKKATVNLVTNRATIEAEGASPSDCIRAIESKGYKALVSTGEFNSEEEKQEKKMLSLLKFCSLFATPALLIGMLFMQGGLLFTGFEIPYATLVLAALATPVQLVGGKPFYEGAFNALKHGSANMDSLIALGTSVAFGYSVFSLLFGGGEQYFEVSAVLITLVLFGKFLEARAKRSASDAIKGLVELAPDTANLLVGGKEVQVDVTQLKKGDLCRVKPGEKIPADGLVVSGESAVNESMITGESIPSEKSKGSKVIGGTINANGSMVIRVSKTGSETALWQIIKLIQEAQGRQAPVQRFADEVSAKFVPAVLALSAITFLSWIYLGAKLDFAVNSAVSVLVIACPCALGLATPTAIMVGTGMGAKKGILIKGGDSLETLCKVENVVFDKTGTLTKGSPQVTDVVPARGVSESQLLSIACALEEHSEHPLAKAVVQACGSRKIKKPRATKFKAIPGGGVEGLVSGKSAKVGSARWLLTRGVQADYEKISELENQGKTVVVVAIGKKAIGFLGIADSPREESKNAVSELSKMGLKVHLLTGDNKRTANAVAEEIGISKENVLSEVHPGEKAGKVMELKASSRGGVAMVGDGINDAPALASASVGIAMGSGTDVAIDSAGIVLMKSNPLDVARAIRLSRETLSTIKQNMFWALAYNVAAIPIAAGVLYPLTGYLLSPAIAGGAMALSSVSVVVNSLRLRSKKI